MIRFAVLCGLVVLLANGYSMAQSREPELYESEQGKFKIRFPSKPKIDTKDLVTGKAGTGPVPVVTERAEGFGVYVAVVYADYPEEFKQVPVKKILDGVRDGLKGKDGKIVTDVDVVFKDDLNTNYRDVRIDAGTNVIRVRLYMVGTRLYQVLVVGDKKNATSKDAEAFFSSFQIVK